MNLMLAAITVLTVGVVVQVICLWLLHKALHVCLTEKAMLAKLVEDGKLKVVAIIKDGEPAAS